MSFKKVLKPIKQREIVNYLMGRYTVGMRQACRCVQMTRSMYYYRNRPVWAAWPAECGVRMMG